MALIKTFRSEILKTKRTASFYFTLIAAAATPFLFFIFVTLDGFEPGEEKDPFNAIFNRFQMTGLVIFPLFVILICTLLPQLEYRNNTWKQVFASPQTKANVFVAKFLNIHLLMWVFLIANFLLMFLVAVSTHFVFPDLNILSQPLNVQRILANYLNAYMSLLAIVSMQFWLGLRFKNFIVPIAIGFGLWLAGTLIILEYHSPYGIYFPYSFHVFANFSQYKSQLNQAEWSSAGYAVLFLGLSFIDFRRMRMNA